MNKKARFDYEILDTLEAGLVLTGSEVKSIRSKQVKLQGGFISLHNSNVWLTNVHIPKYKFAGGIKDYDPERSRKLLLNDKEITYLSGKMHEKGLTVVPISLYTKGPLIKLEIGIARGKKKHDKRRSIKDREQKREIDRRIKDQF